MIQREVWMLVEEIAIDRRISEKWFRWIFTQLHRPNLQNKMMKDRLALLREIAIVETERDARVH